MSIQQLMFGGSRINLNGGAVASGGDPDEPYSGAAGFFINSDGSLERYEDGTRILAENWYFPNVVNIGSSFEVRCTVQQGSSPTGSNSAGVWYLMGDGGGNPLDRLFVHTRTIVGSNPTTYWTFEIRDAVTQTVLATGTDYQVEVVNGIPP